MTKTINETGAHVSKYAAKKANLAKANVEEQHEVEKMFDASEAEPVPAVIAPDNNYSSNKPTKKDFKNKKINGLPTVSYNFPEHIVQIALLIKNNAEIRRFTALGILNYLLQKKEIEGDKRYVTFKWNKFAVKANGLMREYSYNEPFFLNALVAAFSSFSASAQRTIDNFCRKEMSVDISKAVDSKEVETIVNMNEHYQSSDDNVSDVE